MPRINDDRVKRGKHNRNNEIRKYFEKRWNEGIRWEVIVDEIVLKWGVGESTITQIVKRTGHYKN